MKNVKNIARGKYFDNLRWNLNLSVGGMGLGGGGKCSDWGVG